jgi:prolyl-tRNA editing enzyme YbaK/EbsC (Cys-tRNA(Pro) deacylase)
MVRPVILASRLRDAANEERRIAMPRAHPIHGFLRARNVPCTVVPQGPARTAQEGAPAVHAQGHNWVKVMAYVVDGEPIAAMVPAPFIINLARLLDLAGGRTIRAANDDDLQRVFSERQVEAIPRSPVPVRAVFVDVTLASDSHLVVAATPTDAIEMRWTDFVTRVRPIVGKFAAPPLDRVSAFRLSYRE